MSKHGTNNQCPLGLSECFSVNPTVNNLQSNCANRHYCRSVCAAWELPLKMQFVELGKYPSHFTYSGYKTYMKKYGWAEAIQLQYRRFPNYLEVQWNVLKAGFAQAVPLINLKQFPNLYLYRTGYSKDPHGLLWYGDKRTLKQVLNIEPKEHINP